MTPDKLLSELRKAMTELGIPQTVETNEQARERFSAVTKLFLAPYNGRPMFLTRAEVMADLQAFNMLILCFFFPDNIEAKETLNFLYESMLTELNDPGLKQQVADSHRAVDLARGRTP